MAYRKAVEVEEVARDQIAEHHHRLRHVEIEYAFMMAKWLGVTMRRPGEPIRSNVVDGTRSPSGRDG